MVKADSAFASTIVAIDGPAGAGKSTVARMLSERLDYKLVETGLIYRALAWVARERGIAWDDEPALVNLAKENAFTYAPASPGGRSAVHVGGGDVAAQLHGPEVSQGASLSSSHPEVREVLLEIQRNFGRRGRVVVEGRDIGTVVFPEATHKFFITADEKVRALRRAAQRGESSTAASESVQRELQLRDHQDRTRSTAPLRIASDARVMDTTTLTAPEVVQAIINCISSTPPGDG